MLYNAPKKIQLTPSLAKWRIESEKSVLVFVGLDALKARYSNQKAANEQILFESFNRLFKKAKALDVPIIDLNNESITDGMMRLGEYLSQDDQLILAGEMNATFRQVIKHIASVSDQIAMVNDAICLDNQEQHIQWINTCVEMGLNHLNTASLIRLWSLSAPTEFILSAKGILLAIAEQLDIESLELNPTENLKAYGLDSVAIVDLIGLWRANGANICYEDFVGHVSLEKLMTILRPSF